MYILNPFDPLLHIPIRPSHPFSNYLRPQFTFYAAYHDNTVNKWIHIVCIWPLIFTGLMLLWTNAGIVSQISLPSSLTNLSVQGVPLTLNWALLAACVYIAFYLSLEFENAKKMTGLGIFAVSEAAG